jgi:hypothetical protein
MRFFLVLTIIACVAQTCSSLQQFTGIKLQKPSTGTGTVTKFEDLATITSDKKKTLVVYGTYAADFNAIEYAQRIRHYQPQLKEKGIQKQFLILNACPTACMKLAEVLDLPKDVTVLSDSEGAAGRAFGVQRGWLPDDQNVNPYVKLFGMVRNINVTNTAMRVLVHKFMVYIYMYIYDEEDMFKY